MLLKMNLKIKMNVDTGMDVDKLTDMSINMDTDLSRKVQQSIDRYTYIHIYYWKMGGVGVVGECELSSGKLPSVTQLLSFLFHKLEKILEIIAYKKRAS